MRFKLPDDPCRILGGRPNTKKQTKPMGWLGQIDSNTFNQRLRLQGANHKRKYHATRITEWMREGKREIRNAPAILVDAPNGKKYRFY